MNILRSITALSALPGPLYLAIGVFDGVHLGHQAVISTSADHAKEGNGTPVVVTFDPHPVKVLRPENAPHLITATQHKIALIRDLGVAHLLVLHFDRDFAATSAEDFVTALVENSKPLREICVGHEWSFGKGRAGNLALLKKLGAVHDFNVIGVEAVKLNGEVVSSTVIRQAVAQGNLVKATQMLGREYTILGTVIRGEQLGRKLGFPTANLSSHSEQFPPNGVYVTEARLGPAIYRGVANLGFRPTVSGANPERLLELHLFDLDREIYGEEMEVRFLRYLRPEQKFGDLEALKTQIAADVWQARESFALLS
ncbi:MAG TPA: bifunctional riboflavin kinase/FAD synthetase [Chthoniobacterales bacterium]|nr:bifunctional riboflavin kinase/FAD synthetase [Chthoniobacterales bacterium]